MSTKFLDDYYKNLTVEEKHEIYSNLPLDQLVEGVDYFPLPKNISEAFEYYENHQSDFKKAERSELDVVSYYVKFIQEKKH